jgi:hypothetical protein
VAASTGAGGTGCAGVMTPVAAAEAGTSASGVPHSPQNL